MAHQVTDGSLPKNAISYVRCEMPWADFRSLFGKRASPFSISVETGIHLGMNGPEGTIDITLNRPKGNSTARRDQQLVDTLLTSILKVARVARSRAKSRAPSN